MSLAAPMSVTSADRQETQVVPNDYQALDRLIGQGLGVRAVHRDCITWHREPSDSERTRAEMTLGRAMQHSV